MNKKSKHTFIQISILFFIMLFFLCTLSSCKKFLDERPNSKLVKFSISECQALLDDFETMNRGYPSDGEASADNYFVADADLAFLSIEDRNIYTWNTQIPRLSAYYQWLSPYKIVYNANLVLQQLEKSQGETDEPTFNGLKGAALFFRAYAHFQIAQLYAKPYDPATAGQDLGIPIRISPDLEVESERSTVKNTYDQIITDFKLAADLLPPAGKQKSRPTKEAAFAALARTYLAMSDYGNAGTYANECLKIYNVLMDYNSNSISKTSDSPFERFNPEVLFHSSAVLSFTLLPSLAKVNQALYDSYAVNDLRKQVFYKPVTGGFRFSGNYEPVTTSTFFNGLATDEVYLIRAECYARQGKINEAMADLNILSKNRYSAFVDFSAGTADQAITKILEERRKELVFRNLRWSDLRRLNKENLFKRNLSRTVSGTTFTLPTNDLRYVLLIPQEVMSVTNFQQNPR